jgi:transcription elongation factor Elf1
MTEKLAYHIVTRKGIQLRPATPCSRCGAYGSHVVRDGGRATIACDRCGKRLPIIFK